MQLSLYDVTVRGFIQTVTAVQKFLLRTVTYRPEGGPTLEEIVETRLFPDMQPFRFQITQVVRHSVGAIEGVKSGLFEPGGYDETLDYSGLQSMVADALERLKAYTPDEINALYGREMIFQLPQAKLPFFAQDFLLSFSIPNFHFHATTAYDILRMKGVPLGKRDYLGQLRVNR
jgi:hypothetical protein